MINNKKAFFQYNILIEYECGIKLLGTEVKPLSDNNASIEQAYCYFKKDNELYIKNMHIGEHKTARYYIHEALRERKLLLTKKELKDIKEELKLNKGLTIIPLKVFLKNNLIKITIGLCKNKKNYEKSDTIKERDIKRDTDKQLANLKNV